MSLLFIIPASIALMKLSSALPYLLLILSLFSIITVLSASHEAPTITRTTEVPMLSLSDDNIRLSLSQEKAIMVGPWGSGNYSWYFYDHSSPHLKGLILGYSFGYKTIEFVFENTELGLSSANLPEDYIHKYAIGDSQFITEVSTHYIQYQGEITLTSIAIRNNVGGYDVFGPSPSLRGAADYLLPIRSGNIAGFFGENHQFINSLGFYLLPVNQPGNEESTVMVGPWGGSGGSPYDVNDTIRVTKVYIYNTSMINSITFKYIATDGTSKVSPTIGGNSGTLSEIELEDDEYFSSLSGKYQYNATVSSLTLITSSGKQHGPYGDPINGYSFSLPLVKGKIAGFFGRGGVSLDAIGVYLTY